MASHNIGGQAVIEGVMMRDKQNYSVAVRLSDGKIETIVNEIKPWHKIFEKPFLRGIKALVENLQIGYYTLQWSADKYEAEEAKKDNDSTNKDNKKKTSKFLEQITLLLSIVIAVGLFIVLPNLVIHLFGLVEEQSPLIYNLLAGGVRLSVFFLYILGISFFKDVKRIFQYHGAEHKVIHAFEKGLDLNYENIKPFPTLHKRCGTSFLFLLIFMSILIFSLVAPFYVLLFPEFGTWHIVIRKALIIGSHLLLLPLLASLSYELLKVSAKDNIIAKILVFLAYPGLFFQNITTKEPDEKQVEVAVTSLKILLEKK